MAVNLRAEVSLYPTESVDADHVINQSIERLRELPVEYEVGPVSTELRGRPEDVWASLRRMYEEASIRGGEVSMVITLTNAAP